MKQKSGPGKAPAEQALLALLAGGSSIALALSGWSVAAFTAADAWPGPAPDQRGWGRDTLCREKIADLSEYPVQMFGIRVERG